MGQEGVVTFFLLEIPDYKSAMLNTYMFTYIRMCVIYCISILTLRIADL